MTTGIRKPESGPARPWVRPLLGVGVAFLVASLLVAVAIVAGPASSSPPGHATSLAADPNLDPGTALSGRAPPFTLTDQFGRRVSLRSFRGKALILAFIDSQCGTVCPLTTTTMVTAKSLLGAAGSEVQLLAIDANPTARATRWVRSYSQAHGLLHQWRFLTGALPQLQRVWRAYHVEARIDQGLVNHTAAVFVIDPQGRWRELYLTQMAYASVDQQAQILARELSTMLPGHPNVQSEGADTPSGRLNPATRVALPQLGAGTVHIGSGSAHLLVFFATWLSETSPLASELETLNRYQSTAATRRLPALTAVDEGSVEPSPAALPRFARALPGRLRFPVAVDASGRVADGYLVQDQPWFVLTSRSGQIIWYWDAATQGWPSAAALARHVRAALSTPPRITAPNLKQRPRLLAGSPPALAAIHAQAGRLLGAGPALAARLRALRGYPIVLNAWASWCTACQAEYPLFASASVRYGRQVAFLGADTDDTASDARSFLTSHPVSYPSYQSTSGQLAGVAAIIGLPTTIFIDRTGKVVCVRPGQYDSQGALNGDIQTCGLGG